MIRYRFVCGIGVPQIGYQEIFMAVVPHTVDIVVADMEKALAFYRSVGLEIGEAEAGAQQVNYSAPNGVSLGFFSEAMIREAMPEWKTPVGQRVTLALHCDSATELDETYAKVIAAGFTGLKEPWDTFWGQRYAMLQDPDGNRVDLFTELG